MGNVDKTAYLTTEKTHNFCIGDARSRFHHRCERYCPPARLASGSSSINIIHGRGVCVWGVSTDLLSLFLLFNCSCEFAIGLSFVLRTLTGYSRKKGGQSMDQLKRESTPISVVPSLFFAFAPSRVASSLYLQSSPPLQRG